MFNRIPADVCEIVVVYSRSYDVYIEICKIVEKFNDKCVKMRVRDKLTVKYRENGNIEYKLGKSSNREYGKPRYIVNYISGNGLNITNIYRNFNRFWLPIFVSSIGARSCFIGICYSSIGRNKYYIGDCYFSESGIRSIGYNKVNILEL